MDLSRSCGQNAFVNILPHSDLPLQSKLFILFHICTHSHRCDRFDERMQNSPIPHTYPAVPQDFFFLTSHHCLCYGLYLMYYNIYCLFCDVFFVFYKIYFKIY